MKTPTVPEPSDVLRWIEPLRLLLWEALEHGIAVAKMHFGDDPVAGSLGAHLVRYHAKDFLTKHGVPCESIANDGVGFRWGGHYWRVLKSDDGELPVPGRSERKRALYCQQQLLLFAIASDEADLSEPEVFFVVLWDVRPNSFSDLSLEVVCPKAGGATRDSVEAFWSEPLSHAAHDIRAEAAEGDVDDVPMGVLEVEKPSGDDDVGK